MTMEAEYVTRVGRPQNRPADTYSELISLPSRECPDDGVIAGPWVTVATSPWPWNEGPCPCGGVMRWAEAAYVPWHRICNLCGSHWDLRLVRIVIDRERREPCALMPSWQHGATWCDHPSHQPPHVDRCDGCGEVTTDLDTGFCVSLQGMVCECGGHWRTVVGRVQNVRAESWDIVRRMPLMISSSDLTDTDIQRGVIYGGWARRARFYTR
jgi:hypothetical protein